MTDSRTDEAWAGDPLDGADPESEHPLRAHWPWPALVVGLLSAFATFFVWLQWVQPVDTLPMQGIDSPDWWGGSGLLWMLAPLGVLALSYRWPRWRVAIAAAVVPFAVMIGVAIGISDELRWQRQAQDVFIAYTHRFPPGKLGEPEIVDQYESVIDMCADMDPDPEYLAQKRFCIQLVMENPRGKQVIGGYQLHADTNAGAYLTKTDCWGDSKGVCPQDGT